MNSPHQVFDYVLQAVDAETIQGQIAERVVAATRGLIQTTGVTIPQLATQLPPERLPALKRWFS